MRKLLSILSTMFVYSAVSYSSLAQVAVPTLPPPSTKLESFNTNTSIVILKGNADIGSVSIGSIVVSVRCREITDIASGHKEQGIVVTFAERNAGKDTLLIDYDEIASLLSAMEYLGNLQFSVTPLDTYDAEYSTKGGFRVAALGNRLSGRTQYSVRDARANATSISLSSQDMIRLKGLIGQAKAKLDSLGSE